MEISAKKTNLVSWIALGVSVIALVVAVFGACPKRPHHKFGGERGPHPEMIGDEHRGPHPYGQRPEAPANDD
ncbi:MAG: hypothetical protein LBJ73_04465 [Rickettsiales bacterium]|jgi:hypothetical protein|nr:hypothetical protein [Rickettsiales bacterium]